MRFATTQLLPTEQFSFSVRRDASGEHLSEATEEFVPDPRTISLSSVPRVYSRFHETQEASRSSPSESADSLWFLTVFPFFPGGRRF